MITFFNYFEKNYIGKYDSANNIFIQGKFPISFWSCYSRVLYDMPRTINNLEAWHRTINKRAGNSHPTFVALVGLFQNDEELNRIEISRRLNMNFKINKRKFEYETKLKYLVMNAKVMPFENLF
ncbi:hypothetical protein GVAV_001903 [Gurleya vavrai]